MYGSCRRRRGRAAAGSAAVAAVAVVAALLAGCGDDTDSAGASGDGLVVAASFYPLAEAASRVGGDLVEVVNLTPAGTEPHDVELSPDQVDTLEDADLVVYLGDGFQPAVEELAERRSEPTVDVSSSVAMEAGASDAPAGDDDHDAGEGEGDDHGADEVDPHFWLDPTLMAQAVDAVESALGDLSPDDAGTFADNATEYRTELENLDNEMAAGLATCERDEIVTSHAAFHYMAERYGLTQVPIAGLSPESEPSADRLDELSELIEDEGVTVVFYETLVSPEVAEALAREAGVDTAVLNPIEGLTDDELAAGATYASAMRDNLTTLMEALDCEPPG
jgi:zinc transport system substrate-binding protein